MSIKDSLFVSYLNQETKDSMLFTVQEKSARMIGNGIVNSKLNKLNEERKKAFLSFFKESAIQSRVKFNSLQHVIPLNGFSFYKITYQGEFPESLMNAYRKMNELNKELPRDKYKRENK